MWPICIWPSTHTCTWRLSPAHRKVWTGLNSEIKLCKLTLMNFGNDEWSFVVSYFQKNSDVACTAPWWEVQRFRTTGIFSPTIWTPTIRFDRAGFDSGLTVRYTPNTFKNVVSLTFKISKFWKKLKVSRSLHCRKGEIRLNLNILIVYKIPHFEYCDFCELRLFHAMVLWCTPTYEVFLLCTWLLLSLRWH